MIDALLFLLLFISSYFIAGVIHEIGHIIGGHLQGFRFFLLVVGPFGLRRGAHDRLVFYIEKNPAFWGGVGGTFPPEGGHDSFEKFGNVLLCGPLASILFGMLMLPAAILTDLLFPDLLSAMAMGMGVATLIPVKMGAFYSDGGRWWRMRKEGTRKIELAIWRIILKAGIHENYANIDKDDAFVLTSQKDPETCYMGHYFLYQHYIANNNPEQAQRQRNNLQEISTEVSKQILKVYPVSQQNHKKPASQSPSG